MPQFGRLERHRRTSFGVWDTATEHGLSCSTTGVRFGAGSLANTPRLVPVCATLLVSRVIVRALHRQLLGTRNSHYQLTGTVAICYSI